MINHQHPYTLIRDPAHRNGDLSPDPLTWSPQVNKNKFLDYSADNSVSNSIDSPVKLEPPSSEHEKTGNLHSGKTRRATLQASSVDWLFTDDDKEADDFYLERGTRDKRKFVNGLPTVVTRANPTKFYCIKCHYQGVTMVQEKFGKGAWILSGLLFVTLFWPCIAFVCCSKTCKDHVHTCPRCGNVVGKKRFIL